MNKKKAGGEQGDGGTAPVAALVPISPLAGLTFGVDSSIKPLPAALPPTALWVYMNPDVPNDPRIKLPNPPVLLERRWLRYEQRTPDYSEPAETTPLQSEDEGEAEGAASLESDPEGAATRIAAADLQRLLVASSERLRGGSSGGGSGGGGGRARLGVWGWSLVGSLEDGDLGLGKVCARSHTRHLYRTACSSLSESVCKRGVDVFDRDARSPRDSPQRIRCTLLVE
eukprot:scaffold36183_cov56-Phaeocystis_antarctica.AAC.2